METVVNTVELILSVLAALTILTLPMYLVSKAGDKYAAWLTAKAQARRLSKMKPHNRVSSE